MRRKKAAAGLPALTRRWQADAGEYVRGIAFSPTGKLVAVATAAAPIPLLDSATGVVAHALPGHAGGVTALSWHPDGRRLASTGHDGHVRLWDAAGGRQLWSAAAVAAWVERCEFRADGKVLAVAAGRAVRLYQADGGLVRELTGHPSTVADVRWRPDRNELIVARYGGLHVWNPDREQPVQVLNYRGSVLRVSISPTGRFVATADQNSTVHFWRATDWKDAEMSGYPHLVTSLSWDSTGRYLATDGGEDAMVWDCSAPGPEGRMPTFLKGAAGSLIRCVAFAPDRPVCATGGASGEVAVHDVLKPTRQVVTSTAAITSLAWETGSTCLAAGRADGRVDVYADG